MLAQAAETIELLVTVKAYPALGRRTGEAVCVAGVRVDTDEPEWVRLFPIPFRELPYDVRFRKYDLVRLSVRPSADARRESLDPIVDTIEVVGHYDTRNNWADRRTTMGALPLMTTCGLRRQDPIEHTLAWVRPREVFDFLIEERDPGQDHGYGRQLLNQAQGTLFGDRLEVIPYSFKYHYVCEAARCNGHRQSTIDWEAGQLWRRVRDRPNWEELMRDKFLDQMCADGRDVRFYLGNQQRYPRGFLVLGVWWPRA